MKRLVLILILAALLCACSSTPAAPVVEPDVRVQTAAPAVEEDVVNRTATDAPAADAPASEVPATDAPATEAPVTDAPAEQGFAQRVADAWEAAGLLKEFVAYRTDDILDLYGIDLSEMQSGTGFSDRNGYTREALVLETDEASAIEIEQMLATYLESRKAQFRGYDAEALAVAEQAILLREGGIVLFLIAPEAEAMKAAFDAVAR